MNLSSGTQSIIAGAIFDFMGHLTTLPKTIKAGGSETPYDVMDAFKMWAHTRGLDIEKAMVQDWDTLAGEVTLAALASTGATEQRRIAGALLSYVEYVQVADTSRYEDAMLRWASKTGLTLANPQPKWSMTEWA